MDGSTVLNPGGTALNATGAATFITSALPVGPQSITAVYGGDGNFTGSTSSPVGELVAYTPTEIAKAYGINLIQFGSTAAPIAGNGLGQTIAIIDPGDDATITSDLNDRAGFSCTGA